MKNKLLCDIYNKLIKNKYINDYLINIKYYIHSLFTIFIIIFILLLLCLLSLILILFYLIKNKY
jgi:hypothetical protein